MFNITHTSKPGLCKARRCKHPSVEDGLCETHHAEWNSAGRPVFGAEGTAITSQSALPAGTLETLAEERNNAARALELVETIEIKDQASMDMTGAFLSAVREYRAALKKRKDVVLAPVKQTAQQIAETFKPLEKIYEATESALRSKINAHIALQESANRAARVAVEAAGGVADASLFAVAHGVENVALPPGMSVRETWAAEVVDESLLRRACLATELTRCGVEWPAGVLEGLMETLGVTAMADPAILVIDTQALNAIAREHREHMKIPGVRAVQAHGATAARRPHARAGGE